MLSSYHKNHCLGIKLPFHYVHRIFDCSGTHIEGVEFLIEALSKPYFELQQAVTVEELNITYLLLQLYSLSVLVSVCMKNLTYFHLELIFKI